jgi:hypothetical protein
MHLNIDTWRKSLLSMKISLITSFQARTRILEDELFEEAWKTRQDIDFIGYRENDGKRRLEDITDVIDNALNQLDGCDYKTAAQVYHDTLSAVAMFSRYGSFLEQAQDFRS